MFPRPPVRPRPALAVCGGLLLAAAVVTSSVLPDRRAAGADADGVVAPVGSLVPDETLDPRILAMPLTGDGWQNAVDRLDAALFARAENDRELRRARELLAGLRNERSTLVGVRAGVDETLRRLGDELAEADAILRAQAVEQYVRLGDEPAAELLVDPTADTDRRRADELSRHVGEVQLRTRTELRELHERQGETIDLLDGRLLQLDLAIASAAIRRDRAENLAALIDADADRAFEGVRRSRRSATVAGVDLSVVALDAYLHAERLVREAFGGCNMEWWMIAGVARIESRHGRIGGRQLQAAGRPSSPIIGIALDGGPGVRAMYDTDDGRYDGDQQWDRAVGPLQFIPETWMRRGRDATGDGVADPQNIYDAAYSAGRYLCALGGDLSSRRALRSAYFGYNNSTSYVDAVIGHADRYATLSLPPREVPEPSVDAPTVVEAVENAG